MTQNEYNKLHDLMCKYDIMSINAKREYKKNGDYDSFIAYFHYRAIYNDLFNLLINCKVLEQ